MIRQKTHSAKIIDLTGPQGNAFYLLGVAQKSAKDLKLNAETVMSEMKSGDYENLINVFEKYFGEYYILER